MTIETCYEKLGGNYQEISARIPGDALIRRFIASFLNDPTFEALCSAMSGGDRAAAFRAAHTLKGVCANLSFERLRSSSSALTELLRPEADEIPQAAFALLEEVQKDYQAVVEAIREFMAEE